MKIETFQKLQQKIIDVLMLPLSMFIALFLYFWQSKWQSYFLIMAISFLLISAIAIYYLYVNVSEQPLDYLVKMYKNNKKYKTLRKVEVKKIQQPQNQQKKQQTKVNQNQGQQQVPKQKIVSKLIAFTLNQQNQGPSSTKIVPQENKTLNVKAQNTKLFNQQKIQQKLYKNMYTQSSSDLKNIFSPFQKTKSKAFRNKNQQQDFIDEQFEEICQYLKQESQILNKHIQKIYNSQEQQKKMKDQYEQRYHKYKITLQKFGFDKQIIEKLIFQTKLTIKQKIQQHLKLQYQNLDKIEQIIRKNFDINFRSYKQKSSIYGNANRNIYGQETYSNRMQKGDYLKGFNNENFRSQNQRFQQIKFNFNKKSTVGYHESSQRVIKFSQLLQQCSNLLSTHYFDFQYIGQPTKHNQIKLQLKSLINQRLELDMFLYLKKPVFNVKGAQGKDLKQQQRLMGSSQNIFKSQFQQERYLKLLKLQSLTSILNQRQSAQENLLKEYFTRPHNIISSSEISLDQINDESNIQFIIYFMVRTFTKKLQEANSSQSIKVQLSEPFFADKQTNYIWIQKSLSMKSHYNIVYSLKKQGNLIKNSEQKNAITQKSSLSAFRIQGSQSKQRPEKVYICPGDKNIWICLLFVRVLIDKIGLVKEQYPMKNKQLGKDIRRLVELLK